MSRHLVVPHAEDESLVKTQIRLPGVVCGGPSYSTAATEIIKKGDFVSLDAITNGHTHRR